MKVGEINARLKELEVALELSELNRQHAEKESTLAKSKAEDSVLEVKRLEQMVNITLSCFFYSVKSPCMALIFNTMLLFHGYAHQTPNIFAFL